ncbi:MAG: toll/interleukin-1 receptor domain-containing protein [Chloroflexota bacterium]
MPRIFISYRRSDSAAASGRIYDRLCVAFGEKAVFKDVDVIPPGANYPTLLNEAIARCDVLLAIIGSHWLTVVESNGQRRLDNPDDFVRIEIEAGLKRDSVLVIPILVDDAGMPSTGDLPESLRPLYYRNAAIVRNDPDFNRDIGRLITTIRDYYPPSDDELPVAAAPPIPHIPTPTKPKFVLPWTGILVGVLIVISVLATLRLMDRIVERINDNNATANAIVMTRTASSSVLTHVPPTLAAPSTP